MSTNVVMSAGGGESAGVETSVVVARYVQLSPALCGGGPNDVAAAPASAVGALPAASLLPQLVDDRATTIPSQIRELRILSIRG